MDKLKCRWFRISSRSSHLNDSIENIFTLIGKQIKRDAKYRNLSNETHPQFCERARQNVLNFSADSIDRTMGSMPRRIHLVMKNKGFHTKY